MSLVKAAVSLVIRCRNRAPNCGTDTVACEPRQTSSENGKFCPVKPVKCPPAGNGSKSNFLRGQLPGQILVEVAMTGYVCSVKSTAGRDQETCHSPASRINAFRDSKMGPSARKPWSWVFWKKQNMLRRLSCYYSVGRSDVFLGRGKYLDAYNFLWPRYGAFHEQDDPCAGHLVDSRPR